MGERLTSRAFAVLLITPSLVIITVMMIYPLVDIIYTSFTRFFLIDPTGGKTFIGLKNYVNLAKSGIFWIGFKNTLVYVGGTVFFEFLLGFGLALLLNQEIKYRGTLRGLFMLSWITPSVVVALLTRWLFNSDFGVVNAALKGLGLIDSFRGWIIEPSLAMPTMLMATVWKMFPFMLVVLLAGLQTIPEEQMEAARVDGANAVQRFLHITLPNMREIIMIVTLLEFIWMFQYITVIWATTKGGPIYATTTFPVLIYRAAFKDYNLGYAASMGVFWLGFLLLFSVFYVRVVGEKE
jgi:multiple sugar transport system permease protein